MVMLILRLSLFLYNDIKCDQSAYRFNILRLSVPLGCEAAIALEYFYPYGLNNGDSELPYVDDTTTAQIPLSVALPFFGYPSDHLWVATNGIITLDARMTIYTPSPFPLVSHSKMVAPFWADIDTTGRCGAGYWRQSQDSSLMERATRDVRKYYDGFGRFLAKWAFVVTWDNVCGYRLDKSLRNTLQCIIITDGHYSFTLYQYNKIEWTVGTASSGIEAQVGFDAGDGRFYMVNASRTPEIIHVPDTSNVGRPGLWAFRIDAEQIIDGGCSSKPGQLVRTSPTFLGQMGGELFSVVAGRCLDNRTSVSVSFRDPGADADPIVPCVVISEIMAECVSPPVFVPGRTAVTVTITTPTNRTSHKGFMYIVSLEREVPTLDTNLPTSDSVEGATVFNLSSSRPIHLTWDASIVNASSLTLALLHYQRHRDAQGHISDRQIVRMELAGSLANSGRFEFVPSSLLTSEHLEQLLSIPEATGVASLAVCSHIPLWRRWVCWAKASGIWIAGKVGDASGVQCQRWYDSDPGVDMASLVPCPPTAAKAALPQCGFVPDEGCTPSRCTFHSGTDDSGRSCTPHQCFRSTLRRGERCSTTSIGAPSGQQCCYDSNGHLILGPPCGGTADLATSECRLFGLKYLPLDHFWNDVVTWAECCKEPIGAARKRHFCQLYYDKRPSDDGSRWNDARDCPTANSHGDPHIMTTDQLEYTFNGAGEFWMVRAEPGLRVQARMEILHTPSGTELPASAFTAAVIEGEVSDRVQVEVVPGGTLDILANGRLLRPDSDALLQQQLSGISVDWGVDQRSATVRLAGVGVVLVCRAAQGAMSIDVGLPGWNATATGTMGLLGTYNGDPSDDMMLPNGTTIPTGSSLRDIHYNFGLKWMVTVNESLFTYRYGRTYASYAKPDFRPSFDPNPGSVTPEVRELCGNVSQCIFDAVNTQSLAFANATLHAVERYREARSSLAEKVVVCPALATPPGGLQYKSAGGYYNGSIVRFACAEAGAELSGPAVLLCVDGAWNASSLTHACVSEPGGLPTWVWGLIGGAALAVLFVVAAVVTCLCCRRKRAHGGGAVHYSARGGNLSM